MNILLGKRKIFRLLFHLFWALLLFGCVRYTGGEELGRDDGEYVLLGLLGYNYTNRHISEYSVNGASGGHVNLSSLTSGGSGTACCVRMLKKNPREVQVRVRWQVDGCIQLERSPTTGATGERRILSYKETYVDVQLTTKETPNYIETHFYPDGTVQVKLTEAMSNPLLALDGKRLDKSNFPKCKDGHYDE